MANTPVLTNRQRQVKERLEADMTAIQIAEDLGISRNAVYQTISRLRKYGFIEQNFTPSGAPPRSLARVSREVMPMNGAPVFMQLLNELINTQHTLADLAARLAEVVGEASGEN